MSATSFATAAAFRRWLERHHATVTELVVEFFTKASGRGGLTYPEALDEALCFGWIDGIRQKTAAETYTIRFTPRRRGSIWSNVNVRHVARLTAAGKMHAAGRRVFAARTDAKTGIYSFENRPQKFPSALEKIFRAYPPGWKFWLAQPPGYQRLAIWWVISAKQEETRQRRLAKIIALSAAGRRLI
jgi:uncharacterized protein YdeI (YjbR/CyaY-like superfamily)